MDILDSKWNCSVCIDSRQGGRPENQDCYACADTPIGFAVVVCDGMGGGPGGANASTLAVQAILQHLNSCQPSADVQAALKNAVGSANSLLRQTVLDHVELQGMGTTCVVAVVNGKTATVAHVGDSRLYQLRGTKVLFRTADHSVVGEMVRRGELTEEDARRAANSNVITRALGITDVVEPEIDRLSLAPADRLALCTDGVWGAMSEAQVVALISDNKSLREVVRQTMDSVEMMGRAKPGYDNLTLGIVRIAAPKALRKPRGKMFMPLLGLMLVASLGLNAYFYMSSAPKAKSYSQDQSYSEDQQWDAKNTRDVAPYDDPTTRQKSTQDDAPHADYSKDENPDPNLNYQYLKSESRQKDDTIRKLRQQIEQALNAKPVAPTARQHTNKSRITERIVKNLKAMKEPQKDKVQATKAKRQYQQLILKDFEQLKNEYRRTNKSISDVERQIKSRALTEVSPDGKPSAKSNQTIDYVVNTLNNMPVYPAK